jgi:hypothetical protein
MGDLTEFFSVYIVNVGSNQTTVRRERHGLHYDLKVDNGNATPVPPVVEMGSNGWSPMCFPCLQSSRKGTLVTRATRWLYSKVKAL